MAQGELTIDAAWGLAVAIGLMPDPEQDRPALDELSDAMLVWADEDELDAITTAAVARIWDDELRLEIRGPLQKLAAGGTWGREARRALAELDRTGPASSIARAVVQFVAQQLSAEHHGAPFCICCVGELVQRLPEQERRRAAVQASTVARADAAVSGDEVLEAVRRHRADRAAAVRALASDERRLAVRARLGRVGRLARASMPELAAELEALAREPLPPDPAGDPVWREVAEALLDEVAKPELN